MNKRDRLILLHILDTIEEIETYMSQANCNSLESFKANSMLKRAVTMCMISISEIVGNLSDEFQSINPQLNIRQFKQLRNIAAHNYGAISFSKLYDTVTLELPTFKTQLEKILQKKINRITLKRFSMRRFLRSKKAGYGATTP